MIDVSERCKKRLVPVQMVKDILSTSTQDVADDIIAQISSGEFTNAFLSIFLMMIWLLAIYSHLMSHFNNVCRYQLELISLIPPKPTGENVCMNHCLLFPCISSPPHLVYCYFCSG